MKRMVGKLPANTVAPSPKPSASNLYSTKRRKKAAAILPVTRFVETAAAYGEEDTAGTLASSGKIRTVVIIGAGLSGIVSAVHLLRAGIDVTVFERADNPGGAWAWAWAFDPQPDRDPPYPSIRPLVPEWGELEKLRAEGLDPEDAALIFAPPGPIYEESRMREAHVHLDRGLA